MNEYKKHVEIRLKAIKGMLKIRFFLINLILTSAIGMIGQDTLYLKTDSILSTSGPKIHFKENTFALKNGNGEIIEGILYKNTYLWTGRRLISFSGNTRVRLNKYGNVISGYLAEITPLWTNLQNYTFRSNSYVVFNDEGAILQGELSRDTELPVNGKPVEFARAYPIYFNHEGQLVGGTLTKREQFTDTEGKTKACRAGSTVFFNEKWELVSVKENNNP